MDISVNGDKKLSEIREEFHKQFPFLKIEFYAHTHSVGEVSYRQDKLNLQFTVKEAGAANEVFNWHINGLMTVTELEKKFQEKTRLGVNVFRKSGQVWLQTLNSDNKTLDEQNLHGREMSEEPEKEEPEDYHEQE